MNGQSKFWFSPFALCLGLILGVWFRISHLDQKIFWVDEVATVIRAAGYTKAEIIAQLADGQPHSPADLLAYQQLASDRNWPETLTALRQSPEHAPLYFLLVRFWMQLFGGSVATIRSLSVGLSLLTIPAVYALCRPLFREPTIGSTAMLLVAISPFFVAYAQEARPYSLWLLMIVLSSGSLFTAIRLQSTLGWAIYSGTLILSFYTSLLSILVAIGHGLFVIATARLQWQSIWRGYLLALGLAFLAFSPWFWVIAQQQSALAANTVWMRTSINPLSIVAIWLYSFAVVFFDVPVVSTGWLAIVQLLLAACVLSIMGYALYWLLQTDRRIAWFIGTLMLPIPLVLILLDLLFQGQASATPRYLVPSQLGLLLAIAALSRQTYDSAFPDRELRPDRQRRRMVVVLIGLSVISGWINLDRSPDYQKARNRYNPEVAAFVNQVDQPLLLAESVQTMDLLSLSHSLSPAVQIKILPTDRLPTAISSCSMVLLFTPSEALRTTLHQSSTFELTKIYQPQLLTPEDIHLSLWQMSPKSDSDC